MCTPTPAQPGEPAWLHTHVHEPNPAPPAADPTVVLARPDGTHAPITVADLAALPQQTAQDCYIVSTGHGTSGPFRFAGVTLTDLLAAYGVTAWTYADVVSADGFGTRVQQAELATLTRPMLLALACDDVPLTRAQGLVRLIVPHEHDNALRQVKWVSRIEVYAVPTSPTQASTQSRQLSMQPWQTLARRRVLQAGDGRFLRVEYHTVQLPDGRVLEDWPWIDTPSFVNVVAETTAGRFLCFRQSKYAVEGISLSIPGGYLEPGEEPLAAVQRELREETGYAAANWTFLGRFVVDGNRGNGFAHLFLARGAHYIQPIDADDLEEQELVLLTRAELAQALAAGEIKVLPWAANVALALAQLGE